MSLHVLIQTRKVLKSMHQLQRNIVSTTHPPNLTYPELMSWNSHAIDLWVEDCRLSQDENTDPANGRPNEAPPVQYHYSSGEKGADGQHHARSKEAGTWSLWTR
jgi:hypothetical protein